MREAFTDRAHCKQKGLCAAREAARFTWANTAKKMVERIADLSSEKKIGTARKPQNISALVQANGDPRDLAKTLGMTRSLASEIFVINPVLDGIEREVAKEYAATCVTESSSDGIEALDKARQLATNAQVVEIQAGEFLSYNQLTKNPKI